MRAFEYVAPFTLQEAFRLLSPTWGETDILAGGTDLLTLMKQGIHQPKRVVSLKNLKNLSTIDRVDGGLLIGAKVTLYQLFDNIPVRTESPELMQLLSAKSMMRYGPPKYTAGLARSLVSG